MSQTRPAAYPMRTMQTGLAVMLLMAVVAISPGPTAAEHHGNPGIGSYLSCTRPVTPQHCVSVGNDAIHYIYIDRSVPGRLAWAIRRTMREDYGPTNLVLREQSQITRSTDVIVKAANYGQNGAAGWVWCPPRAPQGKQSW